jgi:hypothetical protein
LKPEHVSDSTASVLIPIDMEEICETFDGTTRLSPELANWFVMLWNDVVALKPALVLSTTIAMFYALTFIGPREANTGDPRDNVLTATFATILPMSVFMIACLFVLAAFDIVLNPALRLPPKNCCTAAPAFTCEIKASAVPVSITFIPKVLGALRLEALRLRTMRWD